MVPYIQSEIHFERHDQTQKWLSQWFSMCREKSSPKTEPNWICCYLGNPCPTRLYISESPGILQEGSQVTNHDLDLKFSPGPIWLTQETIRWANNEAQTAKRSRPQSHGYDAPVSWNYNEATKSYPTREKTWILRQQSISLFFKCMPTPPLYS